MKLKTYIDTLDKTAKQALADNLKTSPAYLYQLATDRRKAGATILARIYEATGGNVTPAELRPELYE